MMMPTDSFAAKLVLALKALNLSRGALASALGVDKSLVGRWAAGTVHPGQHNLARLSQLMADRRPGFSMADWDRDIGSLAQLLGTSLTALADPEVPGFSPAFLREAQVQSKVRGRSYEGFWRTSRPSVIMPGRIFRDHGMIRCDGAGQLTVRMGGGGMMYQGVILPHESNLYAIFHSPLVTNPFFLIAKGVALPRAERIEGILLLAALDSDRTPAAVPILLERLAELSGDTEADDRHCEALLQSPSLADEADIEPEVRDRLIRRIGPAERAPTEMFLVTGAGNLSSGTTPDGGLRG